MDTTTTMVEDVLIDRTYQALMGVVQTTAVSRKVLARPPFTFLHKLLVETLTEYDLFSEQQLQFSAMTTKQAKAAFLTRAIAFVTFVMNSQSDRSRVSCLLLVSPVQVLAGVRVPDTLEFLLQLCEVCRLPNRDIKDAAAKEVREKGDAHLYSSSVTFRKGLVLIQGIIRSFLKRRVRKAVPRLNGSPMHGQDFSMTEGTRFLKELADGRIYNGIIRSVEKNVFVLGYEEDTEAEDKVSEIEMKIILEESQRLSASRGSYRLSRNSSSERTDGDISFSDLPDLTESANPQPLQSIKRVVSRDSGVALLGTKTSKPNTLKRAQSQTPSNTIIRIPSSESVTSRKSTNRSLFASIDGSARGKTGRGDNQDETSELRRRVSRTNDWQNSLKKMLAEGRDQPSPSTPLGPEVDSDSRSQLDPGQKNALDTQDWGAAHIPSFPKFGIPGVKQLAPLVKRASNGSISTAEIKPLQKDQSRAPGAPANTSSSLPATRISTLQRGTSSISVHRAGAVANASPALSLCPAQTSSESVADTAFGGTYQTTDQRTQEKQALIRDIVMRIDSYMKRKRLRVIDLFRFCDADGNGSISPEEMIDTLSQMEIQLTPDQAREFLLHIDKDGNGSIDVDEFEELVRVSRRNEAQREQLKKELNGPRKQPESKGAQKQNAVMKVKIKQAILDEFKATQEEGGEGINVTQLRSLFTRLALPGMNDTFVGSLVDRTVEIAMGTSGSASDPLSPPSSSQSQARSPNSKCLISYQHLAKALEELEWSKKSNRFLDQSWIRQFDSQLERAIREYEML